MNWTGQQAMMKVLPGGLHKHRLAEDNGGGIPFKHQSSGMALKVPVNY